MTGPFWRRQSFVRAPIGPHGSPDRAQLQVADMPRQRLHKAALIFPRLIEFGHEEAAVRTGHIGAALGKRDGLFVMPHQRRNGSTEMSATRVTRPRAAAPVSGLFLTNNMETLTSFTIAALITTYFVRVCAPSLLRDRRRPLAKEKSFKLPTSRARGSSLSGIAGSPAVSL
jgi:hypothetical protein